MDLQPHRGEDKVAIPVTFDVKGNTLQLKMSKLYVSLALVVLCMILMIVVLFVAANDTIKLWGAIILLGVCPLIFRMFIIEEYRFRKGYRDLREHDLTYDYSLFWNIYDTSGNMPTFCQHKYGQRSIFVAFDKDVIVGKGYDADFDHYEAISNAYQLLAKKEINCTHIDYMDNVGKDVRLQSMFSDAQKCKNPELRESIWSMLEYMQWYMTGTYSDYDVYCFTSKLRPDLFWDELQPVLNAFEAGNYIRYRILDRTDIRDLVASVLAIPDFSVTRSCDNLFTNNGLTKFIRIIWTETDGKREIVNKTRAQIAEEQRIAMQEKEAAKFAKHNRKKFASDTETIDLFDDDSTTQQQTGQDNNQFYSADETPNPMGTQFGQAAFGQAQFGRPVVRQGAQNRGSFQVMTPVFENTRAAVTTEPTNTYVTQSAPIEDFSDIDWFDDESTEQSDDILDISFDDTTAQQAANTQINLDNIDIQPVQTFSRGMQEQYSVEQPAQVYQDTPYQNMTSESYAPMSEQTKAVTDDTTFDIDFDNTTNEQSVENITDDTAFDIDFDDTESKKDSDTEFDIDFDDFTDGTT